MKALIYHGPGNKAWEEKPKPVILESTDAIIKISKTTICGTDLHILKVMCLKLLMVRIFRT